MQLIRRELFERKEKELAKLCSAVPATHKAKYYWLRELVELHNDVQGHTVWSINRKHFEKDLKKWYGFLEHIRSYIMGQIENDCCFEVEECVNRELPPQFFRLNLVTRRERYGCKHRCLK